MTRARRGRLALGAFATLALVALFGGSTAPAAPGVFSLDRLRLGDATGAENYVYTAGNSIYPDAGVDNGSYYIFAVTDGAGTVRNPSFPCTPAASFATTDNTYTLQPSDPISTSAAWRFTLKQFNNSSCTGTAAKTASKLFYVAKASAYAESTLTTAKSSFKPGATAYVIVSGVKIAPIDWSTTWILPSSTTACANTAGNDRPDASSSGLLPKTGYLQYAPGTNGSQWNRESNYETRPCPAFANGNEGAWKLRVEVDATNFVVLPVFTVDGTPPTTTITASPSDPSNLSAPSFSFSANETGSSFQCQLDGGAFAACTSPKSYSGLGDGAHSFAVKATDAAGNTGAPASYAWTIDASVPPPPSISSGPTDPTNATSASFAFADTEAGVTFLCQLDGGGYSACTSPQGYSGLAEGGHTFAVKARDALGNESSPTSRTWTIDTSPPSASITASPSDPSNQSAPSFSFSANETGSSFQCQLDGGAFAACTSPKSYSGLGDGAHSFAVKATDAAGNTGTPASYAWTIDATAPIVILTAPADGSSTTNPTPTFAGTAGTATGDAATVTVKIYSGSSATGTPVQTLTTGRDPDTGAYSADAASPLAGTYTAVVEQADSAGNTGTSAPATFTVNAPDTTPPTVSLDTPADGAVINDPTPTFSGTAGLAPGDLPDVTVRVYAGTTAAGTPLATLGATRQLNGSYAVTMSEVLPDGTYTARSEQTDDASNTGQSAANTFTVDGTPPTTTITASPSDPSNLSAPSFSFSANETGSSFQCQLDGGAFAACTSPKSYSGLGDGAHSFAVKATDAAGNTGAPASYAWTIDASVPPPPSISSGPTDPTNATSASFAFADTEAGVTFLCQLDGGGYSACTSPQGYSGLAEGGHTFAVKARDALGNESSPTSRTWTIDTSPPSASITASPSDPSNQSAPSFSFSANETGSSFQCQLDGGAFAACTSPKSYSGLGDGAHSFAVKATDAAGNTGTPASYAWTIDATAPIVILTAPADGSSTTNPTPTFAGTAGTATGDAATVTVKIYSGSSATGTPVQTLTTGRAGNGSFSATPSAALAAGTYTAQAEQSDAVSNTGRSSANTFTVASLSSYRSEVLGDNPAAYWRLGETSGTTAADEKGTNPGTYQNGVTLGQPGALATDADKAASFDGVNDIATVPSSSSLNATTGVTVEAWVKRTKSGAWQNIVAKPGSGAAAAQNYALWINTSNQPVAYFGNGSSSASVYSPAAIDTAWHYLVATYDNANAKIYVDGALKASASSSVRLTANTQALTIGRSTDNVRILGGSIDEVAVYPTALSASRIQAHYTGGTSFDGTPPTVTLSSPSAGATTSQTPTFSGQAGTATGDLATITVKVYAGSSATGTPVQTLTTTQGGGSWSVPAASPLDEGEYTGQAEQSDSAGNLGRSNANSFTVTSADITPPSVILVQPPDGSSTADTTPTISGAGGTEADDLPTITVNIYAGLTPSGVPVQSLTTEASGGSWAVDAAPLAEGVYATRAQQEDVAGNIGLSAPHTFTIGASYRDDVLADNPGGYWRLGESSGTVAADEKGTNPGTYQNGVSLARPGALTGETNTAASFDGVDDIVSVPHSNSLNATSGVTVEAWVKRSKAGAWQNIVAKPGNGLAAAQNYALWINTANQPVAYFGNGSSSASVYSPTSIDTAWHYVAATYDNATAKIYIDGVLKASASSSVRLTANAQGLTIGRSTDNVRIFGGVLDEVAVYPTALSASSIQDRYQRGNALDTIAPVVTLTTPGDGTSTLNTVPHFAGLAAVTASDSATVTVKVYSGTSASGTPIQTLSTTHFGSGAWSIDASAALALGTYTAQAEQSDTAANLGKSAAATFQIVPSSPTDDPVLAGAGDIADCADTGDEATANLLLGLPSAVVQTFGDNAYSHGSASDFSNCYDPSWGQVKGRTHPAIGDHEYETPNASGYFNYFSAQLAPYGASASDPNRAYYSYDLGAWHIVVLNAACDDAPACSVNAQIAWLDSDLETHTNACTLAVLHENRWSSGSVHGNNATMQAYWDTLYADHVDVVVGGDEHLYERYAPQDPQGFYDPAHGLREFIVGTGGGSLYTFANINANSEVRHRASYGILKLTLHPASYEWQYLPTSGTFSDSGSTACH